MNLLGPELVPLVWDPLGLSWCQAGMQALCLAACKQRGRQAGSSHVRGLGRVSVRWHRARCDTALPTSTVPLLGTAALCRSSLRSGGELCAAGGTNHKTC